MTGSRGGVSQTRQDLGLANENQIEGAKSGVSQATSAAGHEGGQRRFGARLSEKRRRNAQVGGLPMLGNVMRYKDYYAEVAFDSSADSFHGRVIGMSDVIDFYGPSIRDLRKEFKKSVENYLAWCKEEGAEPEKTWRGKLTFRPSDELRRRLLVASALAGESVNSWVQDVLDRETRKVLEETDS